MSQPIVVSVDLPGRAYTVEIGAGLLAQVGPLLAHLVGARRAMVVSDSIVGPFYGDRISENLARAGFGVTLATIEAGEASKSLDVAAELYDILAKDRFERGEPIVALGGGVVCDVAGFVAATWMRGVPFIACPTTLEAMIDAAVGGKNAVNRPAGKNLVGTFHQPVIVVADTDCLATLPPRDFTAALAESVKHGVIADATFVEWHEKNAAAIVKREAAVVAKLIARNCEIKASIVVTDEREAAATGPGRAALNFGHTIGHALESASGFDLRHGEAVALGMIAELELAIRRCGFSRAERDRIERLMASLGLMTRSSRPINAAEVMEHILMDKKRSGRSVRFVVPPRPGQGVWLDGVSTADIEAALARLRPM